MTTVGDVLELAYGKALKAEDRAGGSVPVVGSGGIVGLHSVAITEDRTIVVGRKGSIGSVTWIDGPAWPIDTAYYVRAKEPDLDLRWTYWMLNSLPLANMNKSAAVPGLNREDVYRLPISVPSSAEQRRIATILDRADAIRAKRQRVLASVDSLAQAVFLEMFSGSSHRMRLGDLATTTSGGTPNRAISANYGGGIPWVKSGELHAGLVTETEETISELGLSSSSAKLFPAGTVVLAMYGATAGVVGRLGIDAATNQAVCGISPGPELDAEYLVAALRAQTRSLVAKAAGGAQPNLSQGIVRDFEIPVPSISEQRSFAAKVAVIGSRRSLIIRALTADEELFASLQARAFRGEL